MCEQEGCYYIELKETEQGSQIITHYREEGDKFIPIYQEFWYKRFNFPLIRTKFDLNESIDLRK